MTNYAEDDIELRKWCVLQANRAFELGAKRTDEMLDINAVARQIYEFVTEKKQ